MRTPSVAGARFVRSSDQSLLVYFDLSVAGSATDRFNDPQEDRTTFVAANENVRRLLQSLESQPVAGVRNLHPAYCSLLVNFDARQWHHKELEDQLRARLQQLHELRLPEPRLVEIPVCYGGEFGPDLEDVAQRHGITPEQVIRLHTSTTYLVYFLGFVPGFAYLGELPAALSAPRQATPRRKVPAGSVGITGNQTGVYPCETPGGWRLLGRTPLTMFRLDHTPYDKNSLLSMGDHVRFNAISREQFAAQQFEARPSV